jgi:hypothetical protein
MTPLELIEKLKAMPDGKQIFCQLVDGQGQALNLQFDVIDIPNTSLIQLRVMHPDIDDIYKLKNP